jgi:hypothetical protein
MWRSQEKGLAPLVAHELGEFLSESRARLLAVVDGIAPELLAKRPSPERWSPLEVIEHLALAEEWFVQIVSELVAEGRRNGLRYTAGQPKHADAVAALAAQMDVRQPQQAPDFTHPTGAAPLTALLERLARSRQALLALLPALDELDTDQLRFRHPTAHWELNASEWAHLSGVHDRQHTRQIRHALDGDR